MAAQLGCELGTDPGYLSRLLSGLEATGLLARQPVAGNAKRLALVLTGEGRKLFVRLDTASAEQVAGLLEPLAEDEQSQLVGAMTQVQRLLGGCGAGDQAFILRDPAPGDLGIVVQRHGVLYAQEYGWDWTFEALVAEIVATFPTNFRQGKERCWIAEREGQVVGPVFVVRADDETAKLRLLYVEPGARALGLGRRLVDECIRFLQVAGYRRMVLWTNDVLVSARKIYQAADFELRKEERHKKPRKKSRRPVLGSEAVASASREDRHRA